MKRVCKQFEKISVFIVSVIFGIFILYLTLLSLLSTSKQGYNDYVNGEGNVVTGEYVYFLPDNPWKHILFFAIAVTFIVMLTIASNKFKNSKQRIRIMDTRTICLIFFISAVGFVLLTGFYPVSDSYKMTVIANEMMQGDFHQFTAGEYMFRYPFQSGFLLYMCSMIKLFGSHSDIFMQIVNAAALAASYFYIGKIIEIIWVKDGKKLKIVNAVLFVFFLPMFFYITFVYGIIIGFMLSVIAIYHELLFFKDYKLRRILISSASLALVIIFKNNYLIFMIAMLLLLLIELTRSKHKQLVMLFFGSVIVFNIIGGQSVNLIMKSILGFDLPVGLPKSTWVVMGVEEGVVSPGSFNGRSGALYEENNYDYEATDKAAKKEIARKLQKYVKDWRRGLDFFGRKQASQWNEPSFQCFNIMRGRGSDSEPPEWIRNLVSGRSSIIIAEIFNLCQTFILAGVCIYIFGCRKERTMDEMIFAIIFIGGFLFHLFWEAKSQYTMLYFFLLIPYMVKGYHYLFNTLNVFLQKIKQKEWKPNRKKTLKTAILLICLMLLAVPLIGKASRMKTFRYIFAPLSENELLEQYEQQINSVMKEGTYF